MATLALLIGAAAPAVAAGGDASAAPRPGLGLVGAETALVSSLRTAPAASATTLPAFEPWRLADVSVADGSVASAAGAQDPEPSSSEPAHAGKKPLFLSFLLPGLGELSMGEKKRAIGFFIAEGLIWTSFAYWTVAGNLRQDDYVEQANLNAGVGVTEESDEYWRLVGQYTSSSGGPGSYEEDLRREARDNYPNDPAAQDAYVAERLPTGDRSWEWSSTDLQSGYQDTRESSNSAFNKAKYSYAAALLNRVVSVIDVQLLRHRAAKESRSSSDAETRVYADALDGGGRLVVQRRF